MSEGSLYDEDLAALAVKQARGDLIEAIFLLRAYRTTLPRFGYSQPLDTAGMEIRRRVSATFKDLPGGQVLGPTFDYTHRLLDPALAEVAPAVQTHKADAEDSDATPHVTRLLDTQGLIESNSPGDPSAAVGDLTRAPLEFPADRDLRLQALARGDEGYLLALGYSTQRGYGRTHPFAGEIRMGEVSVSFWPEELGFEVPLGTITITECEMVNQFAGSAEKAPQFTRGYGLVFGHSERKAMSMALVDRALRARELGEDLVAPAQDEEFVLSHADNVQATGFVEHLKLPHYVDFQAELVLLRQLRAEWTEQRCPLKPGDTKETARLATAHAVVLASHDDTTEAHVEESIADNVAIAEFPTTLEAARKSHAANLKVVMGAPNLVRGGSHSGNVSAETLAREGVLDILSSDYVPASLLQGAFAIADRVEGATLPQALATVTRNPAQAAGLHDRGEIAPGKRADLIRVQQVRGLPVAREVYRGGERVV